MSTPNRFQELGLSYGTIWRILHLDLHLHPYKVQLTKQLKPADHSQRRRYMEWSLNNMRWTAIFRTKFSAFDEANFTLGGYINKQNCRIWGSEDPQVIDERPLHPEKITV